MLPIFLPDNALTVELNNIYLGYLHTVITTVTVFAEIFVLVLISDVTFITKFKKLNNCRCRAQHAGLPRLFRN